MRLLQLNSDNPNFKTLNFKPGINIVAGLQLSEEEKKSINGIGKSMSLKLIHYIFGAKLDTKAKNFLKGYGTFQLHVLHKDIEHVFSKNFAKPEFYIDDVKCTQKEYSSKLTELFLGEESKVSFRHILNVFARRFGGTYYSDVLTQQGTPPADYSQQFTNLFLLGIDISLVEEKKKIKEKINKLKEATRAIKGYEKELDKTNLNDLKDEIERLSVQKEQFIIAENYTAIKDEADEMTEELNAIRDFIYQSTKSLKKKELNLELSENIDIDIEQVVELYKEAKFFFEAKIVSRLEDAQEFHNTLVLNRKKRLVVEISELENSIAEAQKELETISGKRDGIIKDLSNTGALEEYNSLSERIKSLESEKEQLEKFEVILHEFKQDQSSYELKNAEINVKAISYLDKDKERLEAIEIQFRELVKKFYDNSGGSLKIKETVDAKYLFDIDVSIPRDGSQGVGEVKLFCYDVLLYKLNQNLLNFLAHDGVLFSEMDTRQASKIFKILLALQGEDENFQYFLNIGDQTLNTILGILDEDQQKQIQESIILKLYDKDPKEWLFGEEFN